MSGVSVTESHLAKTCVICGRRIEWRRKWQRDWDRVRYCSDRCRRHSLDDTDHKIEATILSLLASRKSGATICPSEAARQVFGDTDDKWRPQMERARMAARRLVEQGEIVITQSGKPVDPSLAKGPIRLRRA